MNVGYDRLLYILPFDHRGSFQTKMFGWKGALTPEQTAEIAAAKQVIYEGFKKAVAEGVPRSEAGILVDEQFGEAVLRDATQHWYITACPAEKSGQDEFDFEYGEDFAKHIEEFNPTFCKVLVRYNPEGEKALNQRQAQRLKRLSDYLHGKGRSKFMFELLVPAEPAQLQKLGGDKKAYDLQLRPGLMVRAIQELQDAGVEPDVWKIEGLDRREDCARVVEVAHRGGRNKVGCIVLGRGEDDRKVREWLSVAAGVPGFVGFAVGRTTFWDPLVEWRAKTAAQAKAFEEKLKREGGVPMNEGLGERMAARQAAVAEVARRYREWVDIFEKARAK
jgi:5-dehydro-2-deoxygluconokinase